MTDEERKEQEAKARVAAGEPYTEAHLKKQWRIDPEIQARFGFAVNGPDFLATVRQLDQAKETIDLLSGIIKSLDSERTYLYKADLKSHQLLEESKGHERNSVLLAGQLHQNLIVADAELEKLRERVAELERDKSTMLDDVLTSA